MEEVKKLFSKPFSSKAEIIFPYIMRELEQIEKNDHQVNYKLLSDPTLYIQNVFYFYYSGLIKDTSKLREWATHLHSDSPEIFDEWNIYRSIRRDPSGKIPTINPETGKDYISYSAYSRLFGQHYDSVICLTKRRDYYAIKVDYIAEQNLGKSLQSIIAHKSDATNTIRFNHSQKLSKGQNQAIDKINSSNVTIMTGGAGTGKTSIIIHLIEDWMAQRQPFGMAIVSPTNMAAENVRDRLLKIFDPSILKDIYIGTIHTYTSQHPHPVKALIIFEESSMYGNILCDVCALNYGNHYACKYLFVGDPNQLPPVTRSSLLIKMIRWFPSAQIELKENFRSDDIIVENSISLLQTSICNIAHLETANNFIIQSYNENTSFAPLIADEDFFNNVMFITYRAIDSLDLNGKIRAELINQNFFDGIESIIPEDVNTCMERTYPIYRDYHKIGEWRWIIGDRARCLVNMPGLIYNGSIGQVCGFEDKHIYIKYKDKKPIKLHYTKLWPAYCITVHTSQGKEWDTVVFCDCRNEGILRSLFYVAITRPKKKAIILRKTDDDTDLKTFRIVQDDPILHEELD